MSARRAEDIWDLERWLVCEALVAGSRGITRTACYRARRLDAETLTHILARLVAAGTLTLASRARGVPCWCLRFDVLEPQYRRAAP